MAELLLWLLLAVVAFAANIVAAVTSIGGAAVLLPFVVAVNGIRDGVPALTVTQPLANVGRGGGQIGSHWISIDIGPAISDWISIFVRGIPAWKQ